MASAVQLSVWPGQRGYSDNQAWAQSYVYVGTDAVYSETETLNAYWYLALDRTTLKVAAKATSTENSVVPQEILNLANGADANKYLLILCTNGLLTNNLPTGDLYTFLLKNGGGSMLARLEQIGNQLGCGAWMSTTYGLVDVMGDESTGFETLVDGTADSGLMTLNLLPVEIDGTIYYSPAKLGEGQ